MLTSDLALRFDPIYEPISRRFLENPDQFADAFARAWFKLTHRDMGPIQRYLGPLVPQETLIWQDPVPAVDHELVGADDDRRAQGARSSTPDCRSPSSSRPPGRRPRRSAAATSAAGPTVPASASSRSGTGRSTTPTRWPRCCARWRAIQQAFNAAGGPKVSLADLIVLGGSRGGRAGRPERRPRASTVPFTPGRTDASQEQTDVESFAALEPRADGFRNYLGKGNRLPAEYLLIDRANLLNLSAPEMTVLVGGLRVLGANTGAVVGRRAHLDARVVDQRLLRQPARPGHHLVGRRRTTRRSSRAATPPVRSIWTGSRADLVFGSNSELRGAGRGLRQRRRQGEVRAATSSPRGSRS